MTTFTASEVRDSAIAVVARDMEYEAEMLRAYADRLEADEKAVPGELDFYDAGLLNDFGGGNVIWWWDYMRDELGRAHSFYQSQVNDMMLVAHSAQAQPPAARVTEEMVERARSTFVQADDGSTGITDAIRAALLVAQTQPPARTCSDERPCVNCFADQGGCLGPAPETVRQRKEQRAVEIAAAISTRHEFSRHESPLILDIVRATLTAQENSND